MQPVHRRYLQRFVPAMVGYCTLIALYGWLVPRTDSVALRVLPMLPVVLAMRAMTLVIREQDELERQVDPQALAAAAVLTSCGFLGLGLLLNAGVMHGLPAALLAMLVLPCFFWIFGLAKLVLVVRLRGR